MNTHTHTLTVMHNTLLPCLRRPSLDIYLHSVVAQTSVNFIPVRGHIILFYRQASFCPPVDEHLGCYQLLTVCSVNTHMYHFQADVIFISFGYVCGGLEMLCNLFEELAVLSKLMHHFTFPPTVCEDSELPHLQHFHFVVQFFILVIVLVGVKQCLFLWFLYCISPTTNGVEYLFSLLILLTLKSKIY